MNGNSSWQQQPAAAQPHATSPHRLHHQQGTLTLQGGVASTPAALRERAYSPLQQRSGPGDLRASVGASPGHSAMHGTTTPTRPARSAQPAPASSSLTFESEGQQAAAALFADSSSSPTGARTSWDAPPRSSTTTGVASPAGQGLHASPTALDAATPRPAARMLGRTPSSRFAPGPQLEAAGVGCDTAAVGMSRLGTQSPARMHPPAPLSGSHPFVTAVAPAPASPLQGSTNAGVATAGTPTPAGGRRMSGMTGATADGPLGRWSSPSLVAVAQSPTSATASPSAVAGMAGGVSLPPGHLQLQHGLVAVAATAPVAAAVQRGSLSPSPSLTDRSIRRLLQKIDSVCSGGSSASNSCAASLKNFGAGDDSDGGDPGPPLSGGGSARAGSRPSNSGRLSRRTSGEQLPDLPAGLLLPHHGLLQRTNSGRMLRVSGSSGQAAGGHPHVPSPSSSAAPSGTAAMHAQPRSPVVGDAGHGRRSSGSGGSHRAPDSPLLPHGNAGHVGHSGSHMHTHVHGQAQAQLQAAHHPYQQHRRERRSSGLPWTNSDVDVPSHIVAGISAGWRGGLSGGSSSMPTSLSSSQLAAGAIAASGDEFDPLAGAAAGAPWPWQQQQGAGAGAGTAAYAAAIAAAGHHILPLASRVAPMSPSRMGPSAVPPAVAAAAGMRALSRTASSSTLVSDVTILSLSHHLNEQIQEHLAQPPPGGGGIATAGGGGSYGAAAATPHLGDTPSSPPLAQTGSGGSNGSAGAGAAGGAAAATPLSPALSTAANLVKEIAMDLERGARRATEPSGHAHSPELSRGIGGGAAAATATPAAAAHHAGVAGTARGRPMSVASIEFVGSVAGDTAQDGGGPPAQRRHHARRSVPEELTHHHHHQAASRRRGPSSDGGLSDVSSSESEGRGPSKGGGRPAPAATLPGRSFRRQASISSSQALDAAGAGADAAAGDGMPARGGMQRMERRPLGMAAGTSAGARAIRRTVSAAVRRRAAAQAGVEDADDGASPRAAGGLGVVQLANMFAAAGRSHSRSLDGAAGALDDDAGERESPPKLTQFGSLFNTCEDSAAVAAAAAAASAAAPVAALASGGVGAGHGRGGSSASGSGSGGGVGTGGIPAIMKQLSQKLIHLPPYAHSAVEGAGLVPEPTAQQQHGALPHAPGGTAAAGAMPPAAAAAQMSPSNGHAAAAAAVYGHTTTHVLAVPHAPAAAASPSLHQLSAHLAHLQQPAHAHIPHGLGLGRSALHSAAGPAASAAAALAGMGSHLAPLHEAPSTGGSGSTHGSGPLNIDILKEDLERCLKDLAGMGGSGDAMMG